MKQKMKRYAPWVASAILAAIILLTARSDALNGMTAGMLGGLICLLPVLLTEANRHYASRRQLADALKERDNSMYLAARHGVAAVGSQREAEMAREEANLATEALEAVDEERAVLEEICAKQTHRLDIHGRVFSRQEADLGQADRQLTAALKEIDAAWQDLRNGLTTTGVQRRAMLDKIALASTKVNAAQQKLGIAVGCFRHLSKTSTKKAG